jgi:hypothetical protein
MWKVAFGLLTTSSETQIYKKYLLLAVKAQKMVMSNVFNFFRWSNPLELCSDHFPSRLHHQGDVNKDAMVLLDGARPPHKYAFNNNKSLMNSKIQPT